MAKNQTVDLEIEGMTCTACARRVEKSLNKVPGVTAYVDFATETAHVQGTASLELLKAAVEGTGYHVGSKRETSRPILIRLAVGVPLTALYIYFMVTGQMIMGGWPYWLAVAGGIFIGWPFHRATLLNLRHGAFTMDTLITLGVAASLIQPHFSDVAVTVPTVVLFGRWLEVRTRRSATDAVRALMNSVPEEALRFANGTTERVATSALKVGDVVLVPAGERVPVDGVVVDGVSSLDNSLITGESVPEEIARESKVSAGAVNLSAPIQVRTVSISSQSRIAKIADLVREASSTKSNISQITDRISAWFVPAVIVISALTFFFGPAGAWIAVLVVACPCALGIAVPMSLAVASAKGAKQGIVIRDPNALSLLSKIRNVVFDKTGTLTTGSLRVASSKVFTDAKALEYASAIEKSSHHPIARAIAALPSSYTASDVTETPGEGMSGNVNGEYVQVVNARSVPAFGNEYENLQGSLVAVLVDGQPAALITLEDDLRPESQQAIEDLKALNIESVLISGDNPVAVERLAAEVGITNWHGGVAPEQKIKLANTLRPVAMVGDGLNDVAALAGADAGIAMGSGTYAAQSASTITILDDDPRAVAWSIRLARSTWANVKQNLFWAFGYNVILIPVAATGNLSPELAGAAMAFSSVTVVLNALRLRLKK
ncbi:MAG: cadmium-translocating P-type ATPase [Actinomycetota bacterium]|jgi:Cu+-exporting ATPase